MFITTSRLVEPSASCRNGRIMPSIHHPEKMGLEACGSGRVSVTWVGNRSSSNSSFQSTSSMYTVRNPGMMMSVRDHQKKQGKNGCTPLCETLSIVMLTDEHEDGGREQGYKGRDSRASKEWPIDKGEAINR
jgi:hypothetical protein